MHFEWNIEAVLVNFHHDIEMDLAKYLHRIHSFIQVYLSKVYKIQNYKMIHLVHTKYSFGTGLVEK